MQFDRELKCLFQSLQAVDSSRRVAQTTMRAGSPLFLTMLVVFSGTSACRAEEDDSSSWRSTAAHLTQQDVGATDWEGHDHQTPSEDAEAAPSLIDDPSTTNDESNDQPRGSMGTISLCAGTTHNGHDYTLDADVEDGDLTSVYFPKGGNVDFSACQLDDDLYGVCEDENGREWEFTGEC